MAFQPVVNLGITTVTLGYDDAATSIVVTSNSTFPAVSTLGAFDFIWWNSTDYNNPKDDPNYEIGQCSANGTTTWTIARAQQDTAASTKNATGKTYSVARVITKLDITDTQQQSWYAYVAGQEVTLKLGGTNAGATTLNLDGVGATAVKKTAGAALAGGELVSGDIAKFIYDGTNFQLVGVTVT
jgi:hypothetical protein